MSDKEAIERAMRIYESACNEGDLNKFLTTFTDDAVTLAPGLPAATGRENKTLAADHFFGPFNMAMTLENDEVEVMGDWAFMRGHYTLTLTPKAGGDAIKDRGKYLDLLRRQADDSWKFARLIWNSDQAAG